MPVRVLRRPDWCVEPRYRVGDYAVCVDEERGVYAPYDAVTETEG